MSGSGMDSQWPNISALLSCLGIWSSVDALITVREASDFTSRGV